jgi:mannose-1-phosphate guanylyltransferase/mannose-6-phosphate isomerase
LATFSEDNVMQLQPVILCGGSGTRLWPASREEHPKQLLSLLGADSLLQTTLHRLDGFESARVLPPLVVGNEKYRFLIEEQMRASGVAKPALLLEPIGRNTAPALTLAALLARNGGDDPLLLVMPADHFIADAASFRRAVMTGLEAAEDGAFVTFGVTPSRAETGYGYLRRGGPDASASNTFVLDAFVEKPDAATAETYLASGEYLWNSGIFLMCASTWLAAVASLQPAMHAACVGAINQLRRDGDFMRVDRAAFTASPSDSIDYAVMEKLRGRPDLGRAVVVPLDAQWSDVGAWDSLHAIADRDAAGNVARGDVLLEDCRDSLVLAQSRLVATLGCEGVVVVETPDAVLVAGRGRSQDVKKVVEKLKAGGREEATTPRKVFRPWGWYDSLEKGPGFQVKRIGVNPGASLSLQMHHHRAEHWVIVQGTGHVTNGDRVFDLHANESTYIPIGTRHRLENLTDAALEIIEVQTGDYLGEDDIVRFEDRYARTEA